jgi:hypothetical protein
MRDWGGAPTTGGGLVEPAIKTGAGRLPAERQARPNGRLNHRCARGVRAMDNMNICRWPTWEGRTERSRGVAQVAMLLLALAAFPFATPAHGQITFGGMTALDPLENTVCTFPNGSVFIVVDDDCDGLNTRQPNSLTIGPAGSQTTFGGADGSAVFGGTATFNSSATFNGTTTFNGGISTGAATFSGTVNMNGGLAVANGQTVDMGGNRVQNVATPTAGTDATNKNYVDGLHNQQQSQIDGIIVVNNQQDARLTNVENVTTQQDTRLTNIETVNVQQDARLGTLEAGFAAHTEQIAIINQNIKSLSRRDRELADGIAIAMALAPPTFQPGQTFAMRAGWGNFDGSNALAVSAAGLVGKFSGGQTVVLDVGFGGGTRQNVYGGRAGLTLGW